MRERARPVRALPVWIALWASAGFHFLVLVGFVWLGGGLHPPAGGEAGRGGAGGETIEITLNPGTTRPAEARAELEPAPATEPVEDEPEAVVATETASRPVLSARDRTRRDEDVVEAPRDEPARQEEGPAAESAQAATIGAGGASDALRTGRAEGHPDVAAVILGSAGVGLPGVPGPGVILRPTTACDDPVEGVWVAHRYRPGERHWARFTLRIERDGDRLSGTILSRSWSGMATDHRPPPCGPEGHDQTFRMPATGWVRGNEMSFGATSYELVRTDCPSPFFTMYAPDHFTGRIDDLHEQLDTVNNDGRYDLNAPYRFRRTGCLDDE